MSDPQTLVDRLDTAEDAFGHVGGRPEFEPELNAAPDAAPGEVQIQKPVGSSRCRRTSTRSASTTARRSNTRSSLSNTRSRDTCSRSPGLKNGTSGTIRGRTSWRKDRSRSRARRSNDWSDCTTPAERNTTTARPSRRNDRHQPCSPSPGLSTTTSSASTTKSNSSVPARPISPSSPPFGTEGLPIDYRNECLTACPSKMCTGSWIFPCRLAKHLLK